MTAPARTRAIRKAAAPSQKDTGSQLTLPMTSVLARPWAGRAGLGRQAVRLPPPRHRGAKVDQTGRPERSRQYVLTTKRRCTREWNRAPADLMPCSQQGRLKGAQPPMQGTRSPVFSASLPPGQPLAWKGAVLKA